MKTMKKYLFLSFTTFSLFFYGCAGSHFLSGQLDVTEKFTLIDDKGDRYIFHKGNPVINLEIKSRKVKLKLRNRVFTFRIPKKIRIPHANGDFYISAADSGQPYDLNGTIVLLDYDEQLEYQSYEHCHRTDLMTGTHMFSWNLVGYYKATTRRGYRIEILSPSRFTPLAIFNLETVTIRRWHKPTCDPFRFP